MILGFLLQFEFVNSSIRRIKRHAIGKFLGFWNVDKDSMPLDLKQEGDGDRVLVSISRSLRGCARAVHVGIETLFKV